jgi:hypothetical protein
MEFLRFGSSIPGAYWGCCCGDIVQNFKVDPDTKASIQIVEGDEGSPMLSENDELLFAGPTYRDIFWQRLRIGTFATDDMPNHFFLATLSKTQLDTSIGKKWLAILKEAGFEFLRTVNNSVWNVDNYVFGLFRNIGANKCTNPFAPPEEWTTLPDVMPEAYQALTGSPDNFILYASHVAAKQEEYHKQVWDKIGPAKLLTESEVVAAGAPVILAGKRSEYPQQDKTEREAAENFHNKNKTKINPTMPFANKA